MKMIFRISLDLPEDESYLRMARELGRTVLTNLQIVPSDIDDVDTLISELYTNVLRHGQSVEGRFQILLEFAVDRIIIYVIDRGPGFAFKDIAPPGTSRVDLDGGERIGGFGLTLIKALSDRVQFRPTDEHGTTVRAEKMIHYIDKPAADNAMRLDRASGASSLDMEVVAK